MEQTPHQFVIQRKQELDEQRKSFYDHWRDVADYVSPRSMRTSVGDITRGAKANQKIVDGTATLALRAFVSGISSSVTNPARPWVKLSVNDPIAAEDYDLNVWLDTSTRVIEDTLIKSNAYTELSKMYSSLCLFGTSAMAIFEDPLTTVRFETFSIGSYWLGSNERRVVDEFMREITMSVRQLVERFGIDGVSPAIKSQAENKRWSQMYTVLHWIGPNYEYNNKEISSKNKRFKELYVESGPVSNASTSVFAAGSNTGHVLLDSGYDEFPIVAPRWDVDSEDTYGTDCPGMQALPDVKRLQAEERVKARALEKQADPPLNVPESMRRNTLTSAPNGFNFVDMRGQNEGIRPMYQVQFDVVGVMQDMELRRQRIRRFFYEDLFLMMANERRSGTKAREVEELHSEKTQQLAAAMSRFNDEALDPLIERVFAILARKKVFPVPPAQYANLDITPEYINVMSQELKMVGIAAQDRMRQTVGMLGQVYPEALDMWDYDEDIRVLADRAMITPTLLRKAEDVQAMRQQRAQANAQREQAAMAQTQANTAQTLSQANTSEDNALTQLMQLNRRG